MGALYAQFALVVNHALNSSRQIAMRQSVTLDFLKHTPKFRLRCNAHSSVGVQEAQPTRWSQDQVKDRKQNAAGAKPPAVVKLFPSRKAS
jgi:hypothetical protein